MFLVCSADNEETARAAFQALCWCKLRTSKEARYRSRWMFLNGCSQIAESPVQTVGGSTDMTTSYPAKKWSSAVNGTVCLPLAVRSHNPGAKKCYEGQMGTMWEKTRENLGRLARGDELEWKL